MQKDSEDNLAALILDNCYGPKMIAEKINNR